MSYLYHHKFSADARVPERCTDCGSALKDHCCPHGTSLQERCEQCVSEGKYTYAHPKDCDCSLHQLPPKERAELFDRAIDATTAEGRQYADVLTIRAAIFDVIDGGDQDDQPWAFYEHDHGGLKGFAWSEDMANRDRSLFADAVIARIAELQAPPHSGVKLENLCDKHKRLALPAPTVNVCVACGAERKVKNDG